MANVQRVTSVIHTGDTSVKLSCFDNTSSGTNSGELYDLWIQFIRSNLGNCCFTDDICMMTMYNECGQTVPLAVNFTKQVVGLIADCFDAPETFRLELLTTHNTVFTWLFVLASDLTET